MTLTEIKLALKELEDAYTLRLFLDNQTTVLAHKWSLVEDREAAGQPAGNDHECLLRVSVGKRQALIAVSRIVLIQKVPFGW